MPEPFSPRRLSVAVFLLLAALCATPGLALPTANLGGVVRSVDGTPLADARILAFERSLGRRVATRSDGAGRYRFLGLTVGEWTVEATLPGFTIAVVEDLRLDVGVTRRLDLEVEPTDFEEMVVESHFSPLVPTGIDGAVTIGRADFDGLPFLERSLRRVEGLLDGPPPLVDERLVDGVLSSGVPSFGVLSSGVLPLEAADQVALRTLHVSAVYAGGSGVVSLLTRSGTNAFHGDAFVLHTGDDLQESAAPRLGRRTWLGGSAGGALVEDAVHAFAAIEEVDAETPPADAAEDGAPGAVTDAEAVAGADRRRSALHLTWSVEPRTLLRLRGVESELSSVADARELLLGARMSGGARFHHGVGVSLRRAELVTAGATGDLRRAEPDDGEVRWDLGSWLTTRSAEHDLRAGFRVFEGAGEDDGAEPAFSRGARGLWIEDEVRLGPSWSLRGGLRWDRARGPWGKEDEISPRLGLAWDVGGNGRHVLRAGAGRFFAGRVSVDRAALDRAPVDRASLDRASLGWSWQLNPFLGLAFDARRLELGDALTEESADVAIRGRFTDAVRFRVHWGVFERAASDAEAGVRHRVVGSVTVDTPWRLRFGAVYRYLEVAASGVDPASQLDVRLARSFDLRRGSRGPELEASLEIFDLLDQAHNLDGAFGTLAAADPAPTVLRPTGRLGLRLRF